jgi:hypothetical protein
VEVQIHAFVTPSLEEVSGKLYVPAVLPQGNNLTSIEYESVLVSVPVRTFWAREITDALTEPLSS